MQDDCDFEASLGTHSKFQANLSYKAKTFYFKKIIDFIDFDNQLLG